MAELIIRDFVDLSSENLVRVLSDEKDKMFGVQKLYAEERGRFICRGQESPNPTANCSSMFSRKRGGGAKCRRVKT
jgi:hypothetical protein